MTHRSFLVALLSLFLVLQRGYSHPDHHFIQKTVVYDGGAKNITYLEAGPANGHLLILMHGWPAVAETWTYQINHFANLGYRVVAPDMPGYGKSTANDVIEDYAHENIITGLLAMLEQTGRPSAVWIGHDWGAGVGSSLVATHPEVVEAMAWLAVPYKTLELGYVEVLPFVNRTTYPPDLYPYGQWEYIRYYEEQYERATSVFNSSIGWALKALYTPGNASLIGTRSPLAEVRRNGGWFGGVNQLPPADALSLNASVLDKDIYNALLAKMSATGFGPADAYYMNHARNRAFNLAQQKNGGHLDIPCLFIQAKYDTVCDTVTSDFLSPMPKYCKNFSFASVDAAHWLAEEKPADTTQAIENWLKHKVKLSCPAKNMRH